MNEAPLRIAVVAGEESGDLLAADLIGALARATGRPVELIGVGGPHLQALGLKPLFDPAEIALMGVTAIVRDLPRLVRRIGQAAHAVVAARPDCLVTVDVPDFALRVAKRVRRADPSIPIVHYVSPSVWAWRPERAKTMATAVDHVLCLLPFEPAELKRLGGPSATFVGHRLTADPGLRAAAKAQRGRGALSPGGERTLLVLPGSRRGEVAALLPVFGETVALLRERGQRLRVLLPTVPRMLPMVEQLTAGWQPRPFVSAEAEAKWAAFGVADAALAASGTVTLELALAGVPLVSAYRIDRLARFLVNRVTVWSASLPNLIADRPVVPEFFNEFVRPGMLARHLEQLLGEAHARAAQLGGFRAVAAALRTERPAGDIAAGVVRDLIEAGRSGRVS